MSAPAALAPEQILADRRGPMLERIRAWQRRSGLARHASAEEVLAAGAGCLWLELARGRSWRQALRRTLYLEWERPRRLACRQLPAGLGRPDPEPSGAAELPPWTAAWLADFAAHAGGGAGAARERGWSRQRARLVLSSLARAIAGPQFWTDLRRRCARVHARAALAPAGCPELRAEARLLLRLLGQLELPPELDRARDGLSSILAARRAAGLRGSPAPSSACTAPRATAGSE